MAHQRISAVAWHERVAQWRASGTSVQAYADQHGVPVARLNYWVKRVEREARLTQLLPVRVQQPLTTATMNGLELRGPSGWTLRIDSGVGAAWLAALLSGLR